MSGRSDEGRIEGGQPADDRDSEGKHQQSNPSFGETIGPRSSETVSQGSVSGMDRSHDAWIGRTVGRYEITGLLGHGGMAAAYRAIDPTLGREVAIKMLYHDRAQDESMRQRFMREAQAAANLRSEHTVSVFEVGEIDSAHFIVMEFLEGGSLADRIQDAAMPCEEATAAIVQACKGLAAAHAKGMIHRDIKPGNLLLTEDGQVRVADFGMVKRSDPQTLAMTQQGEMLGTPHYMSPEQFSGENVDHRSDIYSLGATYYALLTGHHPYEDSQTLPQMFYAHTQKEVPDPREINQKISEGSVRVIRKAMAKLPGDRYQSADEMRTDLENLNSLELPVRASQSGRWLIGSASVALVAAVCLGIMFRNQFSSPNPSTVSEGNVVSTNSRSDSTSIPPLDNNAREQETQGGASASPTPVESPTVAANQTPKNPKATENPAIENPVPNENPTVAASPTPKSPAATENPAIKLPVPTENPTLAAIETATNPSNTERPTAAVDTALPPIKIGFVYSSIGEMAKIDDDVLDALALSIAQFNAQGGLLGRSIELLKADGRGDKAKLSKAARQLISQQKVSAIFDGGSAIARRILADAVEELDSLLIHPINYEGFEQSSHVAYLGSVPNQQMLPAIDWVIKEQRKRRFYLVGTEKLESSIILNIVFREVIQKAGASVSGEMYLPPGDHGPGMAELTVRTAISSGADVILSTLQGEANIEFYRALRNNPRAGNLMSLAFRLDERDLQQLGGVSWQQDYVGGTYFESIDTEANQAFVSSFHEKTDASRTVTDHIATAYAGVQLWAAAVESAGTDNPAEVRKQILHQRIDSSVGEIWLDNKNNHAYRIPIIAKLTKDGRPTIVWQSEQPVAPQPYPSNAEREWKSLLRLNGFSR